MISAPAADCYAIEAADYPGIGTGAAVGVGALAATDFGAA